MSREVTAKNERENRIWWGKNGDNSVPSLKNFISEINQGMMPMSLWKHTLAGHNQDAMKEMLALFGSDVFSTPKPERLIQTVLHIASSPGDIVLDSFAGSGTTGAVAQKMGRRWIMVELGEHAVTHIVPRLKKVIDGTDNGGVTDAVGWHGGGGFRFYRLAPSLLEKDKWGNWVIAREYNAAMLAEAMCKHMGFTYAPSQDAAEYWNHGFSSEHDFIFVTTAALTHKMLAAISRDVGDRRKLLICCKAFSAHVGDFPNLTVVKIPQAVLYNCEWARDDYSLRIANLPVTESDSGSDDVVPAKPSARRAKLPTSDEPDLFAAPTPKGI
jgi:adenine-specific DNA-methyltransferase